MSKNIKKIYLSTALEWESWLEQNYSTESEIWLIFYKKHTKKFSISYENAVCTALCYGWIDSIIKKIDDDSYMRKFNPRHDVSKWSELNKKRVTELIEQGRMKEPGMQKVNIAKQNGCWDKPDRPEFDLSVSTEFQEALDANTKAKEFFESLTKTYSKQFILWINTAKRQATKEKRIKEAIKLLERGEKLGLK